MVLTKFRIVKYTWQIGEATFDFAARHAKGTTLFCRLVRVIGPDITCSHNHVRWAIAGMTFTAPHYVQTVHLTNVSGAQTRTQTQT